MADNRTVSDTESELADLREILEPLEYARLAAVYFYIEENRHMVVDTKTMKRLAENLANTVEGIEELLNLMLCRGYIRQACRAGSVLVVTEVSAQRAADLSDGETVH